MNALGIIFSDSYSSDARHELVRDRSCASLPVACRYRAMDFILSGLVNAGIYNIGMLTKQNYGSLMDHIGSGKDWDLSRKTGGITMLTPFSHSSISPTMMNGKLDALRSVKNFIANAKEEYVILGQGNMIANLDFRALLLQHMKNEADITIVYTSMEDPDEQCRSVAFNENNLLESVHFIGGTGTYDISLNCYVMRKDFLLAFLAKADLYDWHDLNRDLILRHMDCLRIMGYRYDGYAAILDSVSHFYKCNLEMLNSSVRADLFLPNRPIHTRIKDTVPTLYGFNASVRHSLVADGCELDGTVRGSILFRNSVVGTGSVLENCVIMQGVQIGKNVKLKNIICDKDVKISDNTELTGSAAHPYVLTKGVNI